MLQLLTPTGARPLAWSLSERWAMAQTYSGPVRWVIVDDGPDPQRITAQRAGWQIEIVRPVPCWQPGQNTQARNLLAGLDLCDPAWPIVCWEDDDYYAPGWLDHVATELAVAELVGSRDHTYYNVATRRWRQMGNTAHASLCCTAVRGAAISALRTATMKLSDRGHPAVYLDMELWRAHRSQHLFASHDVVGIKGLPGRAGIGRGHQRNFGSQLDPDGSALRHLIGDAATAYFAAKAA
jgi:hypothetical protein